MLVEFSVQNYLSFKDKVSTHEVRAPLKLPKRDIDKFIISKQDWIAKKLAYSAEQAQSRKNFQLNYGDTVLYLGKEYPIVAKQDCCLGFDGKQFCVPPNLSPDQIKSVCAQIYRRLAKRDFPSRVFDFAKQMSVNPTAVKISDAKKCWGSCSSKKSLNFSWRLIMASHLEEARVVSNPVPFGTSRNQRIRAIVKTLSISHYLKG